MTVSPVLLSSKVNVATDEWVKASKKSKTVPHQGECWVLSFLLLHSVADDQSQMLKHTGLYCWQRFLSRRQLQWLEGCRIGKSKMDIFFTVISSLLCFSFQSRRRSATLSVCSSVIARVIGRGGANINAIREATGASIEVEKQSAVRRDQHDRQICIRGTQETVR